MVLLGSGTLVSVGSIRAVLTAHHVVSILPSEGRLGLILGPSLQRHTVDIQGLTYLKIAHGANAADGPDLGAVIFAPSIAGAIAAKKTFYNLDLRRDQLLSAPAVVTRSKSESSLTAALTSLLPARAQFEE